jgi:hypothetical protein
MLTRLFGACVEGVAAGVAGEVAMIAAVAVNLSLGRRWGREKRLQVSRRKTESVCTRVYEQICSLPIVGLLSRAWRAGEKRLRRPDARDIQGRRNGGGLTGVGCVMLLLSVYHRGHGGRGRELTYSTLVALSVAWQWHTAGVESPSLTSVQWHQTQRRTHAPVSGRHAGCQVGELGAR